MIAAPITSSTTFRLAGGAQPLILLPVSISSAPPRECILGTGAGTTLLGPEFARDLDVQITGLKDAQTTGGNVLAQFGRVDSIQVGPGRRENIEVAIADLSHLAHASKPLILTDAHVDEHGPVVFAIDIGASTTVVSGELARDVALNTASIGPITTRAAAMQVSAGRLSSLPVGEVRQHKVDVIVRGVLSTLSATLGTRLDRIIGYNFLPNYTVAIDYPGALLSLFHP